MTIDDAIWLVGDLRRRAEQADERDLERVSTDVLGLSYCLDCSSRADAQLAHGLAIGRALAVRKRPLAALARLDSTLRNLRAGERENKLHFGKEFAG